ncbi:MAG: hypothetical protein HY902_21265 [Deltaproteobacteria bacterium]|nr:hypothetical protein [Deltaproteobacteria bacterium]
MPIALLHALAWLRRPLLLWALCLAWACAAQPALLAAEPAATWTFIKGGNVSAWNRGDTAKVLRDVQRLGLDTVTIPVRLAMPSARSAEVGVEPASLAFATHLAAQLGATKVIIEPYPWIAGGNVPETDLNPSNPSAWFAAYQRALVSLAKQFPNAWGFYIASNLVHLEPRTADWLALVQALRPVYAGKLLYRTQWWVTAAWEPSLQAAWQKKLENAVFGAVDVIAIAAYFELTDQAAPTAAEVKAALQSTTLFARKQNVLAEILQLQKRWNKPIFLGELSCPAVDFGAQTPWDPASSTTPNPHVQKHLLAAYLESLPAAPSQFLGFSLFTIAHPTATTYDLSAEAVEYVRHYQPRPR